MKKKEAFNNQYQIFIYIYIYIYIISISEAPETPLKEFHSKWQLPRALSNLTDGKIDGQIHREVLHRKHRAVTWTAEFLAWTVGGHAWSSAI